MFMNFDKPVATTQESDFSSLHRPGREGVHPCCQEQRSDTG